MFNPSSTAILNYHKIESRRDIGITSRHPKDFRNDLQTIRQLGFTSTTFSNQNSIIENGKPQLILTFDDGYDSVYSEALPIMSELGFTGVVFIPTGFIGAQNTWDVQFGGKVYHHLDKGQIRALSAAGFEIAAHGCSHRAFTTLDDRALEDELARPRQLLQDLTGQDVQTVCYPFGRFDRRVLNAVQKAGYRQAVASLYIKKYPEMLTRYALRRFNIYRFESQKAVAAKLKGNFYSLRGMRDWCFQLGGRATTLYQKLNTDKTYERSRI